MSRFAYFESKRWYTVWRCSDGRLGFEERSYQMTLDMINRLSAVEGVTYEIVQYTRDLQTAVMLSSGQGGQGGICG